MNLNLHILYNEFPELLSCHLPTDSVFCPISTFTRYRKDIRLKSYILYIALSDEEICCADEKKTFFIFVNTREIKRANKLPGFYLELTGDQHNPFSPLMYKLDFIFKKYGAWENELVESVLQKKSVKHLCRISYKMFHCPILVHDFEYKVLASIETAEASFSYVMAEPETERLTESVVKDLVFRKEYLETFKEKSPGYWLDDDDITLCIYMNLYSNNGAYLGRLIVDNIQTQNKKFDALINYLSPYLELAIIHSTVSKLNTVHMLKEICLEYLRNTADEMKERLVRELRFYNWGTNDHYICINIQASSDSVKMNLNAYESFQFDHAIPYCLTLDYEGELILLYNLTKGKMTRDQFCSTIAYIIRENFFHAGISTTFDQFVDFPDFYKQARAALTTGLTISPMRWLFKFENIALRHVLLCGTDSLSLKTLIPPTLVALVRKDHQDDTEYFHTLKNYILYDKKSTAAIETLYVHRSTFKSRMVKIKEELRMNLDDDDTRFYLKIIFHLLECSTERII